MRTSVQRLIKGSFWLFLSQIFVNMFSLIFWLVVSHFSSQGTIGYVGNVLAPVMWISGVFTLGCEYVVLKYGRSEKGPEMISSFLFLQILLGILGWIVMVIWSGRGTFSSIPPLYFVLGGAILFLTCIGSFEMFSLISALKNEKVTQITLTTNSVRLGIALAFIFSYSRISGIQMLISSLIGLIVGESLGAYFCLKNLRFSRRFLKGFKELLALGLPNLPSKVFLVLISGLSLTVLSFLTHDPILVGRTYISLMIMTAISGLPLSFALTSLPISVGERDTYFTSIRYSVGLTSLLASIAISSPQRILEIINYKMGPAWPLLFILMAISPLYALLSNFISKMNYEGRTRELAILGAMLLSSFFVSLPIFLRIAYMEALPLSIGVSSLISLIYASRIEGSEFFSSLGKAEVALISSGILGIFISLYFHSLIGVVPGFFMCLLLLSKLGLLTLSDLREILGALLKKA